jgi:hypothetical protein
VRDLLGGQEAVGLAVTLHCSTPTGQAENDISQHFPRGTEAGEMRRGEDSQPSGEGLDS